MKHLVILPTYNERQNVEQIIREIFRITKDTGVLVVDDNSPDGTGKIVEKLQQEFSDLKLLSRSKKDGLGRAYVAGFAYALGISEISSVIMMDADFSHSPEYLKIFLESDPERNLIVGSRYVAGGKTEGWELWRRLLSSFANHYSRLITQIPVRDCTGGFNGIPTSLLRQINLETIASSGYAFQIELKYRLVEAGAKIFEFPIIFKNRINGESKISNHIIREGILVPWKLVLKR